MSGSEKDRLAALVIDQYCAFEQALAGSRKRHLTREFRSFAAVMRQYVDATREDKMLHRSATQGGESQTPLRWWAMRRLAKPEPSRTPPPQAFGNITSVPTMFLFDRSGKTVRVIYVAPPDLHVQVAEVMDSLAH